MKNVLAQLFSYTLIAALLGCSTVPITGRKQLNLVSAEEETQLGLTSFNEMKHEVPISKDAAANALLQKVGKKNCRDRRPRHAECPVGIRCL